MRDYFPRGGGGHIIVTSRNPTWQGTATEFPVEVFDRQESVGYVLATTQQEDQASASALAEALGRLPLALAQAAAYVSAARISLSDYLDLFQRKRKELWEDEEAPAEYGETVATTWAVAMQRLTQEVPTAAAVLHLCAFLAPDNIPRSLLTEHPAALPEELDAFPGDLLLLNRAVKALREYALLDANAETLTVHRLVQAVTRDRLNETEQIKWIKNGGATPPSGISFRELFSRKLAYVRVPGATCADSRKTMRFPYDTLAVCDGWAPHRAWNVLGRAGSVGRRGKGAVAGLGGEATDVRR